MGDFYQYDGDISFHGWDSFKIGPFENKFKSELLENDYSPLPPHDDSVSDKPVTININKTLSSIKIKVPESQNENPSFLQTLKEHQKSNKSHKPPLSRPRKKQNRPILKKNRPKPRKRKKDGRRPPASIMSSAIMEFLSRPGRNLSKGMSLFMSTFKRNLRRMGSGDGWMMPMLDFLKRPGDYHSNLNTLYGVGSGATKHKKKGKKKKKPSHGKRPRRPRPRPGIDGGGGGISNPLGAVTGVLGPVAGALGGAASAVGGAVGGMSSAASGAMQGIIGDGSLSRKVKLDV